MKIGDRVSFHKINHAEDGVVISSEIAKLLDDEKIITDMKKGFLKVGGCFDWIPESWVRKVEQTAEQIEEEKRKRFLENVFEEESNKTFPKNLCDIFGVASAVLFIIFIVSLMVIALVSDIVSVSSVFFIIAWISAALAFIAIGVVTLIEKIIECSSSFIIRVWKKIVNKNFATKEEISKYFGVEL